MKLTLVVCAWVALFTIIYLLRFGVEAAREAMLNVVNGFVNCFRALFAMDLHGRINSPTTGEIVGFAIAIGVISIPAAFFFHFFFWTIEWALTN